jgi:hypothetical protein
MDLKPKTQHRITLVKSDGTGWAFFDFKSLAPSEQGQPVFRSGDAIEGTFTFDASKYNKKRTVLKSAKIKVTQHDSVGWLSHCRGRFAVFGVSSINMTLTMRKSS